MITVLDYGACRPHCFWQSVLAVGVTALIVFILYWAIGRRE